MTQKECQMRFLIVVYFESFAFFLVDYRSVVKAPYFRIKPVHFSNETFGFFTLHTHSNIPLFTIIWSIIMAKCVVLGCMKSKTNVLEVVMQNFVTLWQLKF